MPPQDDLDPETRDLLLQAAKRLGSGLRGKPDRCDALTARLDGLEARVLDIESERTTATMRDELRAELSSGRLSLVVDTVIRWGVPAILAAAGWSLVTWLRSL